MGLRDATGHPDLVPGILRRIVTAHTDVHAYREV